MRRHVLPLLVVLATLVSSAHAAAPVHLAAEPFPLTQVRLLDGPFRDAMLRNERYLLSLEPDRMLHNFRVNAGLPAPGEPYGGWEGPHSEVRGHTVGHYISACALTYASTGDERFKERVNVMVAAFAQCQAALASQVSHPGYLSAFPESFIDRVETGKPVWAPWYTIHKIMAGLLDAAQLCGNPQALPMAVQMADWVNSRVSHLSVAQMQASLGTEFGGMNEVLANLYAITGNPEHLRLAEAFNHRKIFDPLERGEDHLDGIHANTQIPKIIGAARQYELTGDPNDRRLADFFWQEVALHRSYVIGGDSDEEHFFPVQDFARHLTAQTCETCNTYNMLKLTRHIFEWEPEARVMDFYERALYNHILASQDDNGMFAYFLSLKPGHFKTFSTPENSFWCCVGTGMENHAKYGDTIYFHSDNALYVNLFIPSELSWPEKHLHLRQETQFPDSDVTRLSFEATPPTSFDLKIRWPSWSDTLSIRINGKNQKISGAPSSYVTLHRRWREGDSVAIQLAQKLRTESLPGDTNLVATLRGPIVLASILGTNGVPHQETPDQLDLVKISDPPLSPEANAPLVPLYKIKQERYVVYRDNSGPK
ncbi:MAG TPA: glycoside hydrolase family 127 protein [Verrucomicrobiae bacterium]|jgi:hypothetical protein|nr:glycoside hydrolase family 127 protein [Verrucomicrobiae bacterium]